VPERFPGGLPFSGREYLLHLARVHGLPGEQGRHRVQEWLDRLGAASYADQPVRSMSKGMCQKMALAQALLPSPGLLVLDEAWTGLDSTARGALDAAVTERAAAGGTVLFVDHDPARLAGLEDERWDFGSPGQVTVLAGPAQAAVSVAPAAPTAPRLERVTIRLEAADAAQAVERVRAIDGVRVISVDVDSVDVAGDGLGDVPGTQGPQSDIGGPADADGPRGA
jgi:energy-coupling factor transporter ATP-binding protein EcfA2